MHTEDIFPTIGLEIHAELKTNTKMFCSSPNRPNDPPNTNICPVCLAHPGTLPVINREAVQQVLRMGAAIGGTLAEYTEFDRKNYFYPDLPKGYQLSQYEYPLVQGGYLAGFAVTRIHLEEDTARSQHEPKTGSTLVDYNRAGVPLMELVTEPVLHSAEDAGVFARELQLLLRYLGAGDANMEKGEMRVEANISVGRGAVLGTKVEVKNLNSFRSVERAIAYEIERQKKVLAEGGSVVQETRGWDEAKQVTFSQRKKEGSADYRYFPDPDLPKLVRSEIPAFSDKEIQASLPELPWQRLARYTQLGFSEADAAMLVKEKLLGEYLDSVARYTSDPGKDFYRIAGNYIMSDLVKLIRDTQVRDSQVVESISVSEKAFAELISMIRDGEVASRAAKDILGLLVQGGAESPRTIAEERGLLQESREDVLYPIVKSVLSEHASVVAECRSGKEKAHKFLLGQVIRATKGSGNPEVLGRLINAVVQEV